MFDAKSLNALTYTAILQQGFHVFLHRLTNIYIYIINVALINILNKNLHSLIS